MFEEYKEKRILVVGFGLEGKAIYDLLISKGFKPDFGDTREQEELYKYDSDANNMDLLLGKKLFESIDKYDVIFKSPGARLDPSLVRKLQSKGLVITGLIEEFFKYCPCPIIGVTGTKGKGTTSTMIFEMLKESGRDVYLGGNIGLPAIDFLDKLNNNSIVVLELSSFQLQFLTKSPHIAVVLNVTSEHLDFHETTEEYREAKKSIVRFQSEADFAVINDDYDVPRSFSSETKAKVYFVSKEHQTNGCFVQDDRVILEDKSLIKSEELQLRGKHNLENVTAASMAARLAGVTPEIIRNVLKGFKGLEHRLELVREVDGVKYYNDSFSTVPETAIAAIDSFVEPIILIAGGSYKGSDYSELGKKIANSKVKSIILIGDMADEIAKNIPKNYTGEIVFGLSKMQEIVKRARELSEPSDVVLLSPACASFGLFDNYKDRGDQYKKAVNNL